ncbi:BrnA antitoxin family protein [bacterium]|nr:BrnA antitoxin family protein [bacterium]
MEDEDFPFKEFPFHKARRVTPEETEEWRKAIEAFTGKPRAKRPGPGRPLKEADEKYVAVSIRLHPRILEWAKKQAKKLGVGYQQFINAQLLKKVR